MNKDYLKNITKEERALMLEKAKGDDARAVSSKPLMTVEQHQRIVAALHLPSAAAKIIVEAVAVTRENKDGEPCLDWIIEGGIDACDHPGTLLLVAHGKVTDERGYGEVYVAPPASEIEAISEQRAKWVQNAIELGEKCDRLEVEIEALRKDAERYRWLCEQHEGRGDVDPDALAFCVFNQDLAPVSCMRGHLDAAIDEAMEEIQ